MIQITIQQLVMAAGILGVISFIANIIFIRILMKYGKPVWDQLKAKKMKNPTYICLVYNKNRITEEIMDFTDGIVQIGKKTYIKDPERILKSKPFDKAFFMADDCRPLNLAELELVLDPEVYTRQLELAEMAGAAKMVERLIEELMKRLVPILVIGGIVLLIVICINAADYSQTQKILSAVAELKNITISAAKSSVVV